MNARAIFNRSEAALEYRPIPAREGGLAWYWILLAQPDETCVGSGTAKNRATASAQARRKAYQIGRRISSVRVVGLQEGLNPKEFIEQTPDERRYRVVLTKPSGQRYYYTSDPKVVGGNAVLNTGPGWNTDPKLAMPLTGKEAEERAARCRSFKAAKTLRWEVAVEQIPVNEGVDPKDFIIQNPSWEPRLEQYTGPAQQHLHDDPEMQKVRRYTFRRTWDQDGRSLVLVFDIKIWYRGAVTSSINLTAHYWRVGDQISPQWEESESYYGDMNALVDQLEPVFAYFDSLKEPPASHEVQRQFGRVMRWVYQNPGQVKI